MSENISVEGGEEILPLSLEEVVAQTNQVFQQTLVDIVEELNKKSNKQ